jgi:hypothetical protein
MPRRRAKAKRRDEEFNASLLLLPKALFLKWNFMSVIVAFHSITG